MKNPRLLDLQFEESKFGTEVTLRDLFAAFALAGLHANPSFDHVSPKQLAILSGEAADAMLTERAKGGPS